MSGISDDELEVSLLENENDLEEDIREPMGAVMVPVPCGAEDNASINSTTSEYPGHHPNNNNSTVKYPSIELAGHPNNNVNNHTNTGRATSVAEKYELSRKRSGTPLAAEYENSHKRLSVPLAAEYLKNCHQSQENGGVVPGELELRDDGGVWTRRAVPRGTRYGPFQGKWAGKPVDARYAWEIVAGSGDRGWLDGSLESSNWLKYIRSSSSTHASNVQHILQCGQVWYETNSDIGSGMELILGSKQPLQLQDMFGDSTTSDDKSDRETGSQHSGVENVREDINEEDNETRCCECDKLFNDVNELDEHLVISHRYPRDQHTCDLCPRAYSHRPCLIRHRAIVHGDLRKYPCENCRKVFTDPSNLQRHIRHNHEGARSHACPECGKTFASSSGLKQHTHIHSSHKPFQCEVCYKAYTQFSNLCRHKRMHADCRMKIKCVKCCQSFSTVTSLSKHKRFCDPTTQAQPLNPPPPLPMNNLGNPMANNAPNPFLMYRPPPGLSFFPPHFPYPSLFHPPGHPSAFFNNALLFNQLPKLHEDTHSPNNNNQQTNNHNGHPAKRFRSASPERLSSPMEDRATPPRLTSVSAKVSPPTAEEAHTTPSPARPPPSGNIFSNPREQLMSAKSEMSSDEDEVIPKDFSSRGRTPSVDGKDTQRSKSVSSEEESETGVVEQPLDLSISRKRNAHEAGLDKPEVKVLVCSPVPPKSPVKKSASDSTTNLGRRSGPGEEVIVEEPLKRTETPHSPYEKVNATPPPPMAYPRAIHPSMLLDPMYRNAAFPGLPGGERLLPPPSPFGPPRGFPFLQRTTNYDLFRPGGIPALGNMKPFQDVINQHSVTNKMKDRYACKFCGKVFPRSANLTRHLRTHTGEQPYKCKYCERSFSISSNLQRHVRNIHNKEKPFKCPLCERCFGQQTNLDRHLKKHEADDGSGGLPVADSPGSSNDNEREDAYFDEIRNFMGKVTYTGADPYNQTHLYTPSHIRDVIDVVKDEEDCESFSEVHSPTEDMSKRSLVDVKGAFEIKIKQEKDDLLINNNDQTLKVSA